MVRVLYFAWLRSKTGLAAEEVAPPPEVTTVADLVGWLRGRGEGYAQAFADLSLIKAAVNQEYVAYDAPVGPGDEVAFFPPVTGG